MRKIADLFRKLFLLIYGKTHKTQKKIIFTSFGGRQYSDNPRAISEKMHELYPEYEVIWFLKDSNDKYSIIPKYVKIDHPRTMTWLKDYATAACFVANNSNMMGYHKKKDQVIVRTWHGDRGMKQIMNEKSSNSKNWINTENVDLFVAGSDYGIKRIESAFAYHGEIICKGMPRNDCLVSTNHEKYVHIKQTLRIDINCKVLLYAPTFRDGFNGEQKSDVNLESVRQHLNQKGDNWVCLMRTHFYSKGIENKGNYIDVSDYPDMADILLVTDILITDYSSSSGDFILKNKPVILAHYDLDEYNKNCRELDFIPSEAGYLCVNNDEEMVALIDELTDKIAFQECAKLKKYFGVFETGVSAECVCNRIIELLQEKE